MLNTVHVEFPIVQGYTWSDKIRKFNYFQVDPPCFAASFLTSSISSACSPPSSPIFTTFSVLAELDSVCVSFPHPAPRNPMAATAVIPNTPVTQFFSHGYPPGFKNIFIPIKKGIHPLRDECSWYHPYHRNIAIPVLCDALRYPISQMLLIINQLAMLIKIRP